MGLGGEVHYRVESCLVARQALAKHRCQSVAVRHVAAHKPVAGGELGRIGQVCQVLQVPGIGDLVQVDYGGVSMLGEQVADEV